MANRKKKKQTLLPELANVSIFQSNRVTNAKYDFTLLQERVFTWMIYYMQKEIGGVMNGTPMGQLPLFTLEEEILHYIIPLNYLGRPDQYQEIRGAVKSLATIAVELKNEKQDHTIVTGLFSAIQLPNDGTRTNRLTVQIRRDVAKMLIHVDTKTVRFNGIDKTVPMQYTSYNLRIAATCKNKYTSRIYKLLCSWREKGAWRVPLQELRDKLQLADSNYANFNDFKRRILLPVQEELKAMGDLWFNCAEKEFEVKEGKKVTGLSFRIIQPVAADIMKTKINHIQYLLKTYFALTPRQWDKIQTIFTFETNFTAVIQKIEQIDHTYRDKPEHERQALVIKSLTNEFAGTIKSP